MVKTKVICLLHRYLVNFVCQSFLLHSVRVKHTSAFYPELSLRNIYMKNKRYEPPSPLSNAFTRL